MQRFTFLPRSVLKLLAVFYAICAVGYIAVGIYQAQVAPGWRPAGDNDSRARRETVAAPGSHGL
jgi:hypothetical protein